MSRLCAALIRVVGRTLRVRINDEAGFLSGKHPAPYIFTFWHNRLLAVSMVFERYYTNRKGAVALIGQSRKGQLISDIIRILGVGVVNGATSQGGAAAALELANHIRSGKDINITPDGPQGPCYKVNGGLIFLAQKTRAPILPIHVEYSHCIRVRSWDRFMVPLPFSRVEFTLGALQRILPTDSPEEFETERLRIEKIMQPKTV